MSQDIRILMVEDSALDAELIERELQRAKLDCSLHRVQTERDLRAALESTDPDVILADYNLPDFDGISALKIARAVVPRTPFIFVSGSIGEERAVQALREGATDYILKDRLSRLPAAVTRALRERRERHQHEVILRHAADGIVAVDASGKPFVVNPAASKMTGFSVEEFLEARSKHELIHHTRADGAPYPHDECPMRQTQRDGVVRTSEDVFWRKSGEPFPVDFSCSPIYEGTRIAGCVVTFQDITERKRLERQLEQANRVSALGRVAATIAHEFNNVLMGIQPFAESILRHVPNERTERAARHIISAVSRGKRVTQQILRFTQPAEPALQPTDLADWIREFAPELRGLLSPGVELNLSLPAEPIVVRLDSALMQQVISNLVINARDAMPNGGGITISVSRDADRLRLQVADNGAGIPPDVLPQIFEPLFTTKRSGTGLGLAVVQQIVSRHGGSIHVDSTVGRGTVFSLVLPVSDGAASPSDSLDEQSP